MKVLRVLRLMAEMALLLWMVACSKTAAEQEILANLQAMQQAVEAKQGGTVLNYVADDFQGNGELAKRDLQRLMIAQFLQQKSIGVAVTNLDIRLNASVADRAEMEGVVLLTGTDHLLPDDGRVFKMRGLWQQREGEWLLVSLYWE